MRRFLYDTAVFVYAVGADHPYRGPCREIIERARRRELAGEASVELVQEFAHVRLRRTADRHEAIDLAHAVAGLCRLHDFAKEDLPLTLALLRQHDGLAVRDACFAATALNHEIDAILSPDPAFDAVAGLERIDPADTAAVAALAA